MVYTGTTITDSNRTGADMLKDTTTGKIYYTNKDYSEIKKILIDKFIPTITDKEADKLLTLFEKLSHNKNNVPK